MLPIFHLLCMGNMKMDVANHLNLSSFKTRYFYAKNKNRIVVQAKYISHLIIIFRVNGYNYRFVYLIK